MTALNPNPLANPLNSCHNTNFNVGKAMTGGYISHTDHPARLQPPGTVFPEEFFSNYREGSGLTVPNQDIPYQSEVAADCVGFIGKTSLFRCHNGTIVDMTSGKLVKGPNPAKTEFEYQAPDGRTTTDWGKQLTIDQMMSMAADGRAGQIGTMSDPNLTQTDIDYWTHAEEEAKKMMDNLTDEQKEMIHSLRQFDVFRPSRLIQVDESMKNN